MATVRVDPPALSDAIDYNQWKNKVTMWCELTTLDKKKQAFSLIFALSGKAEQIALEMDHNDLKQDDGVDKLIGELDKYFAKNEVDLSYSAYKDFDQFVRVQNMQMSEYVASFEQKYNKAKKHKLEMSDSVLAFKLLDNASLDETKKQMVLTACPSIKFEDMKSALNRIFNGERCSALERTSSIKEEAFYTNSRFKSNRGFSGRRGGRGRGGFSRTGRGVFNSQASSMKNQVVNGEISRCHVCESIYHYERNCPLRKEEAYVAENSIALERDEEVDVDIVLINIPDIPVEVFTAEAMKSAILDTACTKTVCGRVWFEDFVHHLTDNERLQIITDPSETPFRFGDAPVVRSVQSVRIPVVMGGKPCTLQTEIVERNIPLLLSKESLKKAQTKIDLANDSISMFGRVVESYQTSNGHYAVPLSVRIDAQVPNIVLHAVVDMSHASDCDLKKILRKLHLQFAHASFEKLFQLIKDSSRGKSVDNRVKTFLERISQECETCTRFTKTKPKPIVGFPLAKSFNEVVAMDLHELEYNVYYIHIIDVFSRLSAGAIIRSKSAEVIMKQFLERWVCVFGPPRVGIYTDNGGEFNNDKLRELGETFNFTVKTTAGYSPWSNGIVERANAVITNMLLKLHSEQGISYELALPWALMAKNSLSNHSGYSPFQLVLGMNPSLPSVLVNEPPAMVPMSKCEYVQRHLYVMQLARKNFLAAEACKKINRALRGQIRQSGQQFTQGEYVYYRRDDDWKGPGVIIGQDGVVVIIRHGGAIIRAHSTRVLKRINPTADSLNTSPLPMIKSVAANTESNSVLSKPLAIEFQNDDANAVIPCKTEIKSIGLNQKMTNLSDFSGDSASSSITSGQQLNFDEGIENTLNNLPMSETESVKMTDLSKANVGTKVSFHLDGERFSGTVVSRAGKAGGRHRNWRNIRLNSSGSTESVNAFDLSKVEDLTISGPDSEVLVAEVDFQDAKYKELQTWRDLKVFTEVVDCGQAAVSCRWVLTQKEGNKKARLVARGFEDDEIDAVEKQSPTCSKEAFRILLTFAASRDWTINTIDIKSAFLQGEQASRPI